MAGYDNGTSFWEHMNIYAWIGALLDGYVLVDVLLRIYQDYCNGKEPDFFRTFLPFLEEKEYRDSYCDNEVLRLSKLWKRFGMRFKWGSFG